MMENGDGSLMKILWMLSLIAIWIAGCKTTNTQFELKESGQTEKSDVFHYHYWIELKNLDLEYVDGYFFYNSLPGAVLLKLYNGKVPHLVAQTLKTGKNPLNSEKVYLPHNKMFINSTTSVEFQIVLHGWHDIHRTSQLRLSPKSFIGDTKTVKTKFLYHDSKYTGEIT